MPVEPAMLVIHVDSFIDGNNNKVIDAGESFAVQFSVENKGQGDAYKSASVFPNNRDMMNISTVPVSWMVVIFPQEHRSNTLSVIW